MSDLLYIIMTQNGNLQSWWTSNDVAFFRLKSQCFARQYSDMKVTIPEFGRSYRLDGNYTLTENIADRGGIKVCFDFVKNRRCFCRDLIELRKHCLLGSHLCDLHWFSLVWRWPVAVGQC